MEPAVGAAGAGCQPRLWRQENRGTVLTARGAGKWLGSLVVLEWVWGFAEAGWRKRKGKALGLGGE